ncbi:ABC transporter ATP-binding protein [Calidifontibacillus oryziterrae]|uniref:ABC transporter ATP-binding protein n=1 Tax=Calidifontibacillus oryziterrae TaxID=1191699 RepID=UPI0002D754F1|nr:ABC transporter ATP-binding protein [Calidifontibacillus oryziterrae]
MKFLHKYVRKYWKPFTLAILFLTFEAICDLLQPTIMAKIIDVGVANRDLDYVLKMGGVMLAITAIGALFAATRNVVSSFVSQSFGTELRSDLFKKIQSLSFQNIDRFDRASLVTRLTNDVTQVQVFVNGLMRIFVKAPLLCIGGIIMAARLNGQLAIILAIIVPIIAILIVLNMKIGFPFFIKVQKAIDAVNGVMREYLSGVRVVKAFNRFDYEISKFSNVNEDLQAKQTAAIRIMSVFMPVIILAMNIGIVAVLWFGGLGVQTGKIQVGEIIAFTNYMAQILFSLMMIFMVFNMFVRARASTERIGEVFAGDHLLDLHGYEATSDAYNNSNDDYKNNSQYDLNCDLNCDSNCDSDNDDRYDYRFAAKSNSYNDAFYDSQNSSRQALLSNAATNIEKDFAHGSIEFQDVSFSYSSGGKSEPILKDISFTILPGETIGIIGSTGSGKSTLISLIPRFYDVHSGSIKINGVDVRTMDVKELREKIAIVPQNTMLFTGTIIDNIKWGKEDATDEEVIKAAQIAEAYEFIANSPEGYHTNIGQGGVNLSGGQKQRLSIARALIKNPEILILDDSTSAVDVGTEAKIKKSLKKHTDKLTSIIIAQRISSVIDADKIIVLEQGKIAGIGGHHGLLKDCRVYQEIYESQIGKGT